MELSSNTEISINHCYGTKMLLLLPALTSFLYRMFPKSTARVAIWISFVLSLLLSSPKCYSLPEEILCR